MLGGTLWPKSKKIIFFINHLFYLKVHTKYSLSKQKHILFDRFSKYCLFSEFDQFFRILDHEHKLAKKNHKKSSKISLSQLRTGLNMGEMIKKIFKFCSEKASSTGY